jgi:hypothetical protein
MLTILRILLLMRTVVITVLLAVFCAGSSLSFAASQGRTHRKASQAKSSARARQTAADDDTPAPHTASRKSKTKHAAADPDTPVSTSRKARRASAQDDAPTPARVSRKSHKAAASDDDTPAPASHKLRRASAQQDDAAPARTTRASRRASASAQQDDTPARTTRKTRRASTQDDDTPPARTSRASRRAAVQDDGDTPARGSRKMRRASASAQQDDDTPPVRSSRRSRRGRVSLRNVDLDRTRSRRHTLVADPAPAAPRSRSVADDDTATAVVKPHTAPESPALPTPTNSIPMHAPIVAMAPLRGSMESLVRQNEKTDADNLERIEDDADLDHRIAQGVLVPVPASAGLTVNSGLPQNRRYCRPWTASFLADLARAHQAQFHHAFFVSSAVRTVDYQKRLILTNGNAAAAEGDVASPHLTGATIDIAKNGMSRQELYWMRNRLDALQEEGKIDVEEEFRQACFHITVYKSYIGAGPLHKPHHNTTPSDAAGAQAIPVGPPTDGD